MGEGKAKGKLPPMRRTVNEVYAQAYERRDRTILMARASLGGCINDRIVKSAVQAIREQAEEALLASRHYRNHSSALPWRRAAEQVRKEAILICAMSKQIEKAADGTIIFEPKHKRMRYNLSILNCYERMLEALTCLRDLEPAQ